MFAPSYFAPRYFAPRYFPPDVIVAPTPELEVEGGGDSSRVYRGRRRRVVTSAEVYRQWLEAKEIRETSVELPVEERIEVEQDIEAIAREIQARLLSIQDVRYRKMVRTRALKMAEILLAKQKAEALDELAPILMILLAEDL